MHKIFRTVAGLVAGLFAIVALSGCIKFDVDSKVRSDLNLDGKVIVGLSTSVIDLLVSLGGSSTGGSTSGTDIKSKADFIKDIKKDFAKLPKGVSGKVYDKGGFVGAEYTFTNLAPDKILSLGDSTTSVLNDSSTTATTKKKDTLSIKKVGNKIVLNGRVDLGAGDTGDTDTSIPDFGPLLNNAKAELRFKFTFPGKVTKSNGKISGNSVTWTPAFGKVLTLTAEANSN